MLSIGEYSIQFGGYVLAGWVLSQVTLTKRSMAQILIGITLALVSTAYLMLRTENLNLLYTSYSAPLLVLSSMGLFVLAVNSENLLKKVFSKFGQYLSEVSKASFGVFLAHMLVLGWANTHLFVPTDSSLQTNLARWIVVLVLSYTLVLSLTKVPAVKKLVT